METPEETCTVVIVCDGSVIGKGEESAGGAAALLFRVGGGGNKECKLITEYRKGMNSQQAEIVAACIGLESLSEKGLNVTVVSDSMSIVRTMTDKRPPRANKNLLRRLKRAAAPHTVVWKWVRGHTDWRPHAVCDQAARRTARRRGCDEVYNARLLAGLETAAFGLAI